MKSMALFSKKVKLRKKIKNDIYERELDIL
jgi:polyphosphate kinase 2